MGVIIAPIPIHRPVEANAMYIFPVLGFPIMNRMVCILTDDLTTTEAAADYISYTKTSHNGYNLMVSGGYQSYVNTGIFQTVNKYIKRAIMMQGKYDMFNEMNFEGIDSSWLGYDWVIRTELSPHPNLKTPKVDGSTA